MTDSGHVIIALAGNPNCGKTTIFNALTGQRHHVGNWPGVTVERRSGAFTWKDTAFEVVDLPGTYSLSAQSEDERIASRFLAEPDVDVIVNVLDASNLERNLYLTTQLLDLRRPVVFVLNMWDDAERSGIGINVEALSLLLGGPVIPTVGNREEGLMELKDALLALAQNPSCELRQVRVSGGEDIERELAKLEGEIRRDEHLSERHLPRQLAIQLLEGAPEAAATISASHARTAIHRQLESSRTFLEHHLGADAGTLLAERRYGFAHGLVAEVVTRGRGQSRGLTDRLDAFLTHRLLGIPIFLVVMTCIYAFTFVLGKYPQEWIASGFAALQAWAGGALPPGELTSLLVEGILPGVGAVVVFVPVIMLLMGAIAFLEDTGYMSRAAFIMDRLMHLMGLHGKSFIPLVMGTGCNVPAVQATRTIEARDDRFITILVAPLVSCSARLQVYILIAGAFFPPLQAALAILAMHVLGFAMAMVMGKLLRHSFFRGENAPFVMELPPYRLPVLKATLVHMWEKGSVFLSRAGTTILVGATLIWFLSHYPGISNSAWSAEFHAKRTAIEALQLPAPEKEARLAEVELAHQSRIVNTSLAARFGKTIEPLLAPLFDPDRTRSEAWKDGIALTAGFVAKEIVVSTMAVIHEAPAEDGRAQTEGTDGQVGGNAKPGHSPLQDSLLHRSGLTPLTALAFMVFTLLYTPCLGTVGMIYKETRSLAWTSFSVVYGIVLAWGMAWLTLAGGRLLGGH